jgi:hypothetical protein
MAALIEAGAFVQRVTSQPRRAVTGLTAPPESPPAPDPPGSGASDTAVSPEMDATA